MVTSAGGADTTIVIEAQDRASATIKKVGNSLKSSLGTQLRSTTLSMISFTAILSAVGLSISGLVQMFRKWTEELKKTNAASARFNVQLRLTGLSADEAAKRVGDLIDNVGRLAVQTLPTLDEALRNTFLTLTPEAQQRITALAEEFAKMRDIPFDQVFEALLEGLAGNLQPLHDLGLEGETFNEILRNMQDEINAFEEGKDPFTKFVDFVKGAGSNIKDSFLEAFNTVFGSDGTLVEKLIALPDLLMPISRGLANSFIEAFNLQGLGARILESIAGENESLLAAGKTMALSVLLGMLDFFIGETGVEIVKLAIQGEWKLALEKLKEKVLPEIGIGIGKAILGGLLFWLPQNWRKPIVDFFFGFVPRFITETVPKFFSAGWELAKAMAQGFIDSVHANVQRAINFLIDLANKAIEKINRLIPPGIKKIDTIGSVNLGQAPQLFKADLDQLPGLLPPVNRGELGAPLPGDPGRLPAPINLTVKIGETTVDRIVVDSLGRNLRTRAPGTQLG